MLLKSISRLLFNLFAPEPRPLSTEADIEDAKRRLLDVLDPLDPLQVQLSAREIKLVPASAFSEGTMDAAPERTANTNLPVAILAWYQAQSFIGFNLMAIIAQHWLVNKACSMMGKDGVRNWFDISRVDGKSLDSKEIERLKRFDKRYKLRQNLEEFSRYTNVFGIRIAIFQVDSTDPEYYEKPFNLDGVTAGSYRGISQVDPNWCTPILRGKSLSDPSSAHFYEPDYWMINGKRYHRTHLVIGRTEQPSDILKPTYQFAGISLVQKIFERIYAAERSANESPLLLMTKRTTSLKVNTDSVAANQGKFEQRLRAWMAWRDNFAVKVLGEDEELAETDTTLADVDDVVMQQYLLVASVADIPVARLLGTSPSGLNATGEFEMASYYDAVSTLQENLLSPFVERHHAILSRSLGLEYTIEHTWRPLDTPTAEAQANVNKLKADADSVLILAGVVTPSEARQRLRQDPDSGYNFLAETEDETEEEL